jgi:tetratricopeptide (TPR) repeat protein
MIRLVAVSRWMSSRQLANVVLEANHVNRTARSLAASAAHRFFLSLAIGVAVLALPAQCLFGASCSVVKHGPPTEADKALLASDFGKAENLYKADLAAHPGDADATSGLVRALLHEQKVSAAADVVKTAVNAAPKTPDGVPTSGSLLTLIGELKFAQGNLWEVEPFVLASYKQDPCNPRTRFLFARIAQATSRYAMARQQLSLAHQFDPADAEIRQAWIATLPLKQQIGEEEAFLAAPEAQDEMTQKGGHFILESLKKEDAAPVKACRLASGGTSADTPLIRLMGFSGSFGADRMRVFGLEVQLNSAKTRLQIDTKTSGITVYRSAANRAGLKRLGDAPAGGDPNMKAYTAYADSIHIGGLEFQNCAVTVLDAPSMFDDGDGSIGMDAFSQLLITLDLPMRKLLLAPLPLKPGQTAAEVPVLLSNGAMPADPPPGDRFIAPDMKDWTQFYHIGPSLILPAAVNADKVKLFAIDAGSSDTIISTSIALEMPNVHERPAGGPGPGGPGPAVKTYYVDVATINFAHMSQTVVKINAVDTSFQSKAAGTQISGAIGWGLLKALTMHIDYRDGLVKFDYVPDRGYKFE